MYASDQIYHFLTSTFIITGLLFCIFYTELRIITWNNITTKHCDFSVSTTLRELFDIIFFQTLYLPLSCWVFRVFCWPRSRPWPRSTPKIIQLLISVQFLKKFYTSQCVSTINYLDLKSPCLTLSHLDLNFDLYKSQSKKHLIISNQKIKKWEMEIYKFLYKY